MTSQKPTHLPELNTVLEALSEGIQDILKDKLIGVYLQGSFAVGDSDMGSDVDFIVVVEDELTKDEVATLQAMHQRIHDMDIIWAKHLEGSYFPKAILRQYEDCSADLWYLDNGSREFEQSTHCNMVLVRWVVREMGVTLFGASPLDLVGPIPVQALRQEIMDIIHDWGNEIFAEPEHFANHFYQLFILQSYCRMLHDLIEGKPSSKRASTDWAKANLDPKWHDLIDRSWSSRGNSAVTVYQPANPEDFQATLDFVRFIMKESEKYRHLL